MGTMPSNPELFLISMAAEMLGMHPQTLRKYERLGLIQPSRSIGSMRLYSREELERLRLIKRLVDELGINLAGVQRLLSIAEVVHRIQPLMDENALRTGAGGRQPLAGRRGSSRAGGQRRLSIAEVVHRIQPLMDENALSTGAGRRQLLSEMRRL